MSLFAYECAPLPVSPYPRQVCWLRELASRAVPREHLLHLTEPQDPGPLARCTADGTWWAGRYVGALHTPEEALTIEPRFGPQTLATWLGETVGVPAVGVPPTLHGEVSCVLPLVAGAWGRALADAARRPGPLRRQPDGPLPRLLVAAWAALHAGLGSWAECLWLPDRTRSLLPLLRAAVGPQAPPPTRAELDRLHWGPALLGFEPVVRLSRVILEHRSLLVPPEETPQNAGGLLLDVAELWGGFVRTALRRAARGLEVRPVATPRGTSVPGLGPALVVRDERGVRGVLQARYGLPASLYSDRYTAAEEFYRLGACLARFPQAQWAAIACPLDPLQGLEEPPPWRLEGGQTASLLLLPHEPDPAAARLRAFLEQGPTPPAEGHAETRPDHIFS